MVIMKTEHSPHFSLFRVVNTDELNISTYFLKMVVAQSCEMLYIYHTRLFSPCQWSILYYILYILGDHNPISHHNENLTSDEVLSNRM
jgi:hypothetical protein